VAYPYPKSNGGTFQPFQNQVGEPPHGGYATEYMILFSSSPSTSHHLLSPLNIDTIGHGEHAGSGLDFSDQSTFAIPRSPSGPVQLGFLVHSQLLSLYYIERVLYIDQRQALDCIRNLIDTKKGNMKDLDQDNDQLSGYFTCLISKYPDLSVSLCL
jgi:hypothetical protein